MLTTKQCNMKLIEIHNLLSYIGDSKIQTFVEYKAHLQRLKSAYENEYLKAVDREEDRPSNEDVGYKHSDPRTGRSAYQLWG